MKKFTDAKISADKINKMFTSQASAKQFILEELDAARQGNSIAVNFAKNSGFKPYEYIGAMQKTKWVMTATNLKKCNIL